MEREMGTLRYIIDFTIKNAEINILYCLILWFFSLAIPGILGMPCYGLVAIFMT